MQIVVLALIRSIPPISSVAMFGLFEFVIFAIIGIQLFSGRLGACNQVVRPVKVVHPWDLVSGSTLEEPSGMPLDHDWLCEAMKSETCCFSNFAIACLQLFSGRDCKQVACLWNHTFHRLLPVICDIFGVRL